ncbi:MAG: uroporphyrinogen-III synthase [Deltaproteobacteria bacterium]|nr:uroporphyrinogen-III synthase [Deltaproteobacteria bacterium]
MSSRIWSHRSFLVTRPRGQGEKLADLLRSKGATVYHIPLIKVVSPTTWERLDGGLRWLSRLGGEELKVRAEARPISGRETAWFAWAIFTSRNAVDSFIRRRTELGIDLSAVRDNICFTAIGRKTAEAMEANGLKVDWVPQTFTSEGLIESFQKLACKNVKVLIVQAEEGRMEIRNWLTEAGAEVTVAPAYRVMPDAEGIEELRRLWKGKGVDTALFASPSAVESFVKGLEADGLLAKTREKTLWTAIGPVTAASLREFGLIPSMIAEKSTEEGVVEGLERYFARSD